MVHSPDAFKGAGLLLVDIQQRLAPAILGADHVIPRIAALLQEARRSNTPILATEQYSRGLGHTVAELRDRLAPEDVFEKIHFAATREPAFRDALNRHGRQRWIVAGMEAHVCVLQTVLGLLAAGVEVTLAGDAVASRVDLNRRLALARMARAGARISDTQRILGATG